MGARLAELAWTEVAPLLSSGSIAVLPVGAAAKEHGPHLPMSADWLTAEALGRELARRADVLVWPTVGYGFYPAFVAYPGSTSLAEATFEATMRELAADLVRAGARAVLVVNTGISTIRPIDAALGQTPNARAAHVYRGARYLEAASRCLEQERGGHADEAETSILLHLHPEHVRMDFAFAWTRDVRPGRWSPTDTKSPSYSPSGVLGDPRLASATKGEELFEAMLADLLEAVVELSSR
jgi:creatinine amidohydrolase